MVYNAGWERLGWRKLGLVLYVLLFVVSPGAADMLDDLKPVEGYVVATQDGEFIIDLDGKNGIVVGDIFSVIVPGDNLIHPVTKKVIGKLEEVKSILRVVRIGEGFSFARQLDSTAVQRGDRIRRFASLKAVFWDYSGNNKALYDHLQYSLSSLKWQDYRTTQGKRPAKPAPLPAENQALYFIADRGILTIRDANFDLVRQYSLDPSVAVNQTKAPTQPARAQVLPEVAIPPAVNQAEAKRTPAPVIDYGVAGNSGQLIAGTVMADLLSTADERILAVTDGRKISAYLLRDKPKLLAEKEAEGYGHILAVSWWQPEAAEPPYLAVLVWTDSALDTALYSLKNNRLELVKSGIDTILGAFDLDGDGRPETLLSQRFDAENFFGRRINEMYWQGSSLQQKAPPLQLPPKFTVIGGQLADLTGDGNIEAAYIRNGALWVYAGKKRIYTSANQMGGSLSVLTYKVDPTLVDFRTTSVFFEVAPLAVDVDGDGRKELLAVSTDQSAIRAPGIASSINKSRILVFNYENGAFAKGTVGEQVEAAIQGLDTDGKQVLFVATDSEGMSGQEGNSRLQTLNIAL